LVLHAARATTTGAVVAVAAAVAEEAAAVAMAVTTGTIIEAATTVAVVADATRRCKCRYSCLFVPRLLAWFSLGRHLYEAEKLVSLVRLLVEARIYIDTTL